MQYQRRRELLCQLPVSAVPLPRNQLLSLLLHSLTILDCGLVSIGNNVEIGPNVSIITGEHHTMIEERRAYRGYEFTRSVVIGDDCWIGAGAIILAGVTIGSGCSIGAGSVVKANIPPFSIAVGVPARVIRSARSAKQESTVE